MGKLKFALLNALMKTFSVWLVITLVVFGASSGGYHVYLTKSPRKVLVAVDSSGSMKAVWNQVPQSLKMIAGQQRYVIFSLVTEKSRVPTKENPNPALSVPSWSSELQLGTIIPYLPRDFAKLTGNAQYPEVAEAQQKYLITDAEGAQSQNWKGWTIIRLTP